jgi:hypothetical protein
MQDLFENIEILPQPVQSIFEELDQKHNDAGIGYPDLSKAVEQLEEIGMTFDYNLACDVYDLEIKDLGKYLKMAAKSGQDVEFTDQEKTLSLSFSYGPSLSGDNAWKVHFNGAFVKITKTPQPALKKALELIEKHSLEIVWEDQ